MKPDWRPYFPEEKPRPLQAKVLDLVTSQWDLYDNFVLELPTGVGKSAIAMCLARWLNAQRPLGYRNSEEEQPFSTYITTTSLALEKQYVESYAELGLQNLHSADHYQCNRGKGLSCGDGKRISTATKTECPGLCPYKAAKDQFIFHPYGITNGAFYVNITYYAKQLLPRGLHIFDEAHTVGDLVKNFVTIEITEKALNEYRLPMPQPDEADNGYNIPKLVGWLGDQYLTKVEQHLRNIWDQVEQWTGAVEDPRYLKLADRATELDKHACRVRRIVRRVSQDQWVAELIDGKINITPIRPTHFMQEIILGHSTKRLFMSATILDMDFFMSEYDLEPSTTFRFSSDSPFPVENRPIYYWPVGKVQYNQLERSMRPFAEAVKDILAAHKEEKGIIFVSSYAQAEELMRQVNDSRLITHGSTPVEKDEMMAQHARSKNTCIVTPTLKEGLDLVGDLSRYQIVVKLPFASLGAKDVLVRAEQYPAWYNYVTALSLIQMTGRSVRSDTDHAVTYILDSNFSWFRDRWHKFLPQWWLRAVVDN